MNFSLINDNSRHKAGSKDKPFIFPRWAKFAISESPQGLISTYSGTGRKVAAGIKRSVPPSSAIAKDCSRLLINLFDFKLSLSYGKTLDLAKKLFTSPKVVPGFTNPNFSIAHWFDILTLKKQKCYKWGARICAFIDIKARSKIPMKLRHTLFLRVAILSTLISACLIAPAPVDAQEKNSLSFSQMIAESADNAYRTLQRGLNELKRAIKTDGSAVIGIGMEVETSEESGTRVFDVLGGGPADRAGIKRGDFIVSIAGDDPIGVLSGKGVPGSVLTVTIMQQKKNIEYRLVVGILRPDKTKELGAMLPEIEKTGEEKLAEAKKAFDAFRDAAASGKLTEENIENSSELKTAKAAFQSMSEWLGEKFEIIEQITHY